MTASCVPIHIYASELAEILCTGVEAGVNGVVKIDNLEIGLFCGFLVALYPFIPNLSLLKFIMLL